MFGAVGKISRIWYIMYVYKYLFDLTRTNNENYTALISLKCHKSLKKTFDKKMCFYILYFLIIIIHLVHFYTSLSMNFYNIYSIFIIICYIIRYI